MTAKVKHHPIYSLDPVQTSGIWSYSQQEKLRSDSLSFGKLSCQGLAVLCTNGFLVFGCFFPSKSYFCLVLLVFCRNSKRVIRAESQVPALTQSQRPPARAPCKKKSFLGWTMLETN